MSEATFRKIRQYIDPPAQCDLCDFPISHVFVDGRVEGGSSWANMCLPCWHRRGTGLGTGSGQVYAALPTSELQEHPRLRELLKAEPRRRFYKIAG